MHPVQQWNFAAQVPKPSFGATRRETNRFFSPHPADPSFPAASPPPHPAKLSTALLAFRAYPHVLLSPQILQAARRSSIHTRSLPAPGELWKRAAAFFSFKLHGSQVGAAPSPRSSRAPAAAAPQLVLRFRHPTFSKALALFPPARLLLNPPPSNPLTRSLSASALKLRPPHCPLLQPLKAVGLGTEPELAYATEAPPVPLAHPSRDTARLGACYCWVVWRRRQKETHGSELRLIRLPTSARPISAQTLRPPPILFAAHLAEGGFPLPREEKGRGESLPKQRCREGCKTGWGGDG